MRPTTVAVLAALTVVAVGAAATAVTMRAERNAAEVSGGLMFPEFVNRANDATTIMITSASGTVTLKRPDDLGWVLAERAEYPVPIEKVRRAIAGIAALRLVEPKTDNPERYARLEVEDPTAKDAKSRLVTVKNAAGNVLAEVIIGKGNYTMGQNSPGGVYVRRPNEARSWLAEGSVEAPAAPNEWLERQIVDVPNGAVKRITYRNGGEEVATISRDNQEQEAPTLSPVPPGRSADPAKVRRMASTMSSVLFEDVRPAEAVPFPPGGRSVELETFGGLTVRADITDFEGGPWVRFAAQANPPPGAAPASEGVDTAAAQADRINKAAGGFVFKLPEFKLELLTPKLDDLLQKPTS